MTKRNYYGHSTKIKICGVYMIRNKITGDCYIGSSVSVYYRMALLMTTYKSNEKLKAAIKKYGKDSFEFIVLKRLSPMISKRRRFIVEAEWQHKVKPVYNIKTLSKDGGEPLTKEILTKISKANKGRKRTIEYKKEAAKRMLGNTYAKGKHWTLSSETKLKMSESMKGNCGGYRSCL